MASIWPRAECCCRSATAASSMATRVFDTTRTFGHRIFRLRGPCRPALPHPALSADRSRTGAGADDAQSPRRCSSATATCLAPGTTTGSRSGSAAVWHRSTARNRPGPAPRCWSNARRCRCASGRTSTATASGWSCRRNGEPRPEALSPRAKTSNYLNMIVADQEVTAIDPGPGRCCSTCRGTSPRAAAATCSWSARASC